MEILCFSHFAHITYLIAQIVQWPVLGRSLCSLTFVLGISLLLLTHSSSRVSRGSFTVDYNSFGLPMHTLYYNTFTYGTWKNGTRLDPREIWWSRYWCSSASPIKGFCTEYQRLGTLKPKKHVFFIKNSTYLLTIWVLHEKLKCTVLYMYIYIYT